jgi:hypothetical protein
MPTNTRNPQDNWPCFRHLLEQLLENLETQTDIVKSLLEEGDHADYLDFITAGDSIHRPLLLDFGTSNTSTFVVDGFTDAEADALNESLQTLRDDTNENTSMANRSKLVLPSRDEYPNQRKPWTRHDELDVICALYLGFDKHWIAEKLGRNSRAVQDRIEMLRKHGEL